MEKLTVLVLICVILMALLVAWMIHSRVERNRAAARRREQKERLEWREGRHRQPFLERRSEVRYQESDSRPYADQGVAMRELAMVSALSDHSPSACSSGYDSGGGSSDSGGSSSCSSD